MIVLISLLIVVYCHGISSSCPKICDQVTCAMGVLLCVEPGLRQMPDSPPQPITNVSIANQIFPRPFLGYRNMSKYGPEDINLKSLTIQNCGLVDIESESFSHLIHLNHLDLSDNDLRSIRPRSFKALNLKLLKLDGNQFLTLNKDSLEGLVVNALSLANCGLTALHFHSIKEISGHLTRLILSRNKIKTLSFRFVLLFRRLEMLQLDNNRFKCDCHLRWLVVILLKLSDNSQSPTDVSATCSTPLALSGRVISSIPESLFECFAPSLRKISIDITTAKSATLFCEATAPSETTVFWKHRNFTSNTTSIHIRGSAKIDRFSCIAINDNGNVTVDLKIQWPPRNFQNLSKTSRPPSGGHRNVRYFLLRQFSLWELLLSIATTFVITIVIFTVIYVILSKRVLFTKDSPKSMNRSGYDGALYSDIPVYDVPQLYSPRIIYPSSPTSRQSAHLIDFKTQRPLGGGSRQS